MKRHPQPKFYHYLVMLTRRERGPFGQHFDAPIWGSMGASGCTLMVPPIGYDWIKHARDVEE